MTIEEAKEYIPDFEAFCKEACDNCGEAGYCPRYCEDLCETCVNCGEAEYCHLYCEDLCKAARMDFNRILKCYARNDGEMYKVLRWLKQARI